jgi:hypothetical protein
MGLERGDGDMHPLGKRQRAEETIELSLAVRKVQANNLALAGCDRRLPEPKEMPFSHQVGGRRCLGLFAALDLRLRGSLRNVDFKLD